MTSIRFHGGRSARAPLIHGQRIMWNILRSLDGRSAHLNQEIALPVPGGLSTGDVCDVVRALVEHHEVLRTRFPVDAAGEPFQQVLDVGVVDVEVREDRRPDDLLESLAASGFREADELPIRVGLTRCDGAPNHVVLVVSHLAVDGWSRNLLEDDLRALLDGRPVPAVVEQPVDRARYEASPAGLRKRSDSLAHWRRTLLALPAAMIEGSADPRPADYDTAVLDSPVVAHCLGVLGRRYGTTRSTCLSAAVSLVQGFHQGVSDSALWIIVATRFRTASRRLVAAFNQNALFRPDWSGPGFGEFVESGFRQTAVAYRNCEYAPVEQDALLDEISERRGLHRIAGWYYNDFSSPAPLPEPEGDEADLVERLPGLLAESVVTTLAEPDGQVGHRMFFRVRTLSADHATLLVSVERAAVRPGGAAAFLRDVEAVLVAACGGEVLLDALRDLVTAKPPAGLHPAPFAE